MKTKMNSRGFGAVVIGLLVLVVGASAAFGQVSVTNSGAVEGYDPFELAASVLGLTADELDALVEDGKSIAQVARDRDLAPSIVVDALVQADAAEIDAALASEEIEEADEWRDVSYVFAVEFVYLPVEELFWDEFEEFEDWDEFEGFEDWDELEEFEGFDGFGVWELEDELGGLTYSVMPFDMAIESQRSMAYSLLDNGVEPEAVVDAVLDAETSLLDQIAEISLIDQIIEFVLGIFDADGWFAGDDEMFEDELFDIVAQELSIDEDTLWDALDEGQTIAELAQAAGKDPQAIVATLVAEEETLIAELVADDELTTEEADEWRADSQEYYTELVFDPWF